MERMPLIEVPFPQVAVDLIGPITPASDRGHRYVLVVVDYATRYPEATHMKKIDETDLTEVEEYHEGKGYQCPIPLMPHEAKESPSDVVFGPKLSEPRRTEATEIIMCGARPSVHRSPSPYHVRRG